MENPVESRLTLINPQSRDNEDPTSGVDLKPSACHYPCGPQVVVALWLFPEVALAVFESSVAFIARSGFDFSYPFRLSVVSRGGV